MTERTAVSPEALEKEQDAEPKARVPARRSPGRPKGTSYACLDAPLHEEMRQLREAGVPSLMEAARRVANRAYGWGTQESIARRLVRRYPY
jgi:hypothetical protein